MMGRQPINYRESFKTIDMAEVQPLYIEIDLIWLVKTSLIWGSAWGSIAGPEGESWRKNLAEVHGNRTHPSGC